MEEPNLADYWNDVQNGDTTKEPRVLSTGEMLDRIVLSIQALWAIEAPWTGDKSPTIIVKVIPPDAKKNNPLWQVEVEASPMSDTEGGRSFEEAVIKLHRHMTGQYNNKVKEQQAEVAKKRAEIAKIEKSVEDLNKKVERYQNVLDKHTT